MVSHLMVLNPKAKAGKMAKRRRRKMTAKQLRYFGPRRRSKSKGRARAKVVVVSANPKRRRRRSRVAAVRVSRRRFRRNPLPSSMSGFLSNSVMPAAVGAAGAVGVDYVLANFVPLVAPANLVTANTLPLWRIAGAFGVGMLVSMAAGEKAGAEATAGALTVTAYNMARNYMFQNMPNVQLARYVQMNRYLGKGGVGFVRRPGMNGVGGQQNRIRQLGLKRLRRLRGLGPVANTLPGNQARSALGAGNPNNVTKFRILRDGSTGDDYNARLGYIGPGRTLGRYLGGR